MFALAIRPVVNALRQRGLPMLSLLPPLCLSCALGVYLGLRLRFNSRDALTHAPTVVEAAHDALFGPGVAGVYVAAFAAFLWLVYTVADIWFDGLQLRTAQWRGSGRARTGRSR